MAGGKWKVESGRWKVEGGTTAQRALTVEGLMMISTRRLLARFSGLRLSAIGLLDPIPTAEIFSEGTPRETR